MNNKLSELGFRSINKGYNNTFQLGKLTVGLVVPIENYANSAVPTMQHHLSRIQAAEQLGFSAVWLRDVPFNVPSFGDAGQLFDPFVYLGYLSAATDKIALGVASIILPLRHPAHLAKAASSTDVLSDGRLILGVASGDRPQEYPAMNAAYENRGKRFRAAFEYIKKVQGDYPAFENIYGHLAGDVDMLPKTNKGSIPMLITGGSQQSPEWAAQNADGWMTYPHAPDAQKKLIQAYQSRVATVNRPPQPVMQPLYLDLIDSQSMQAQPIHLGFKTGVQFLVHHLKKLEQAGVNHVALNLRFNQQDIDITLKQLAEHVLPEFS